MSYNACFDRGNICGYQSVCDSYELFRGGRGGIYSAYNREEYILLGDSDDSETAENVMRANVEEKTVFAGQVEAKSYMTDKGAIEHGAMASAVLGICVNEVGYTERYPGIGQFVDENRRSKKVEAMREIRNTGNNLRRWQSYGKLLSE